MDWFARLTGFVETDYQSTRGNLVVEKDRLRSQVNDQSYGIGQFELVSLADLRARVRNSSYSAGKLRFSEISGDVGALHAEPEFADALFQVASQFNMLEMTGPQITPEDGVTRYQCDPTQGPACAIAAGAATIYRNYFVKVGNHTGQTAERQLDGLANLGKYLSEKTGMSEAELWKMRNGYALGSADGLTAISRYLAEADYGVLDAVRGQLSIGLHWDVEVTLADGPVKPVVSQAFCSALPVAYSVFCPSKWEPFARLVLEAAYEATFIAGLMNASRSASNIVLITRLGGGVFGNDGAWIDDAIERALVLFGNSALNIRLVRR